MNESTRLNASSRRAPCREARRPARYAAAGFVALLLGACSATDKQRSGAPPGESAAIGVGGASDASVPSSGGASSIGTFSADAGVGAPPPIFRIDASAARETEDASAVCSAEVREAEQQPLDMLILMDGSGSMADMVSGGRKWDLVVGALSTFANDPASAGIGVGLTYFGIPAGYDAGDLFVSCDVSDYSTPAVAVKALPGNARGLESSLSAYTPVGGTPTLPALQGAVAYAHTWLAAHPTHRMVIVLATDGEPNDCNSTVDAVSAVASAAAAEKPPISTYVIGVGSSLSNLDQIAAAGGTDHAYIVDTSTSTTASFTAAMNAIRGEAALPCQFEIPAAQSGKSLDFGRVNVAVGTGADAGPGTLLQVPSASACDASGGWYYDDPTSPAAIELCPTTCSTVMGDPTAMVSVLIGCKTEARVIR
ncbi:MAG TPA: vWA domain-containing protein [Polyangiaceae bacterium]|nr:vWA domain-containing protein [Polyangiaceae bacterium]